MHPKKSSDRKNVFEKGWFSYKIQFAVEKTKKIGAISKLLGKSFCVAIKKMLGIEFLYLGIV